MTQQPGCVPTQLHRGTVGSTTFINVAVWESAWALGRAFGSPEFQARLARYPDSTVTPPRTSSRRSPSRAFVRPRGRDPRRGRLWSAPGASARRSAAARSRGLGRVAQRQVTVAGFPQLMLWVAVLP